MDYLLTPEQEAFRDKLLAWLPTAYPANYDPKRFRNFETKEEWMAAYRSFEKKMYDAGYVAMHYPKEWGGQGKTIMEETIVMQAIAANCMELRLPGAITMAICAPAIASCGTEEQKREFLPKMLDGTQIWCQGFSEPNAGSDVANVSTRAVRKGDHYIVDGQKTWTSLAHMADHCVLVCRTDPTVAKHKGLSYLLVDMNTPGIEVRPMVQMTGEAEFNEVFFDNVKVPVERRLGEEGQGWMITITTLMFERTMGDASKASLHEKEIGEMIAMAKTTKRAGKPVIEDPIYRQQLGQAIVDTMVLKYNGLRNLYQQIENRIPGPEGSIGKLLWSEPHQRTTEAILAMQGIRSQIMGGSPWSIQEGYWQYNYLRARGGTIEAGTSEIQRNIIGERCLGLPKDVSRGMRQQQ